MVRLFPETKEEEEDWLLRLLYPVLIAVVFLITFAVLMCTRTLSV